MQNQNTQTEKRAPKLRKKILGWVLLLAMIVQMLSISCFAISDELSPYVSGSSLNSSSSVSGITNFKSDEVIAELKKQFLGTINQDLITRIDDQQLKGEVGVIISFSENSLVEAFGMLKDNDVTFEEYRTSRSAKKLQASLEENQNSILAKLLEDGVISEVKYQYYNILDGAYVRTTYEQLEAITAYEGVGQLMISNTYNPAVATDNEVHVYDTGIFNSSDVTYTGMGTIVAILDTGCDYAHTAFTTYTVKNPLYDRDDIEKFINMPDFKASSYNGTPEAREVYYGNLTGNKIAYGYDYADKDPDIMPFNNSHGTHVAGIIAGKDDNITGVAIDAQLAIMKVFSDYKTGAEDGDILAALEDSVILGVDAINMSLGTSCGFSREVDEQEKNDIYDRIEAAGISLIVAASNDHSSGYGSENGNTNKTDNPDSATIGSPSTYKASLSVASINGRKEKYMYANGTREVFFHEAYNMNAKEYSFFEMLGVNENNKVAEFEYVTIPGLGYAVNYSGLDMTNKIALVRRGDITFEEKVQYAYEAGAAAIIVYNNVFGDIIMTVGNDLKIPVISIGKDDGEALAATSTGTIKFDYDNVAGPFMSDFSSWGPNPDLTLKPEITAHGGNIYSATIGGEYEEMSGTSMAAPNMCGITVLIRQYVKEKYPKLTAAEVRDLVNQLCMSTATIALDMKGNPYSPRKQGAGIADITKATTTGAYLYVDGIGKTKLELFDDPDRTGVYEMTINLKNISDKSVSYNVGIIAMTESISTSDPEYVAEMAYLLSGATEYSVTGGTISGNVVTVEAGKTAKVTAKLTLSDADKAYINSTFENGMYVEGFLTFDNVDEKGVDLNAPFLAFYGDWGEAPLFDLDYYEVETEAHNNAIDDEDKIKADYYATTPLGNYYYDYILPLGSYVYKMDEVAYTPIPATREHAAVSYFADSINGIYAVYAGLLRGAKEMTISIVDTATGKEVWSDTQYNCYKAHYSGAPVPYAARINLPMVEIDYKTGQTLGVFGSNNTRYEVTMSAKLDWDKSDERNSLDTYSFSFYIDYEAPSVVSAEFRKEYDKSREEYRYYVDTIVYDNHYAMSIRPVIVYNVIDDKGREVKTYSGLTEFPIPIYQENIGETTKVTLEITDYLDIITNSATPEGLTLYVDDYAMNGNLCYIPFPETESDDLEFVTSELELDINETFDLATYLVHADTADSVAAEPDYLKALKWSTSDDSVVIVSDGKIQAVGSGSATISVTGNTWTSTEIIGGKKQEVQLYKNIVIKVSENVADVEKPQIEAVEFTYYNTLFAFNGDIDFSEIGRTDSINYFGGKYSLSFYPSEQVKLNYNLEPWNLTDYELKWTSSNPKVATVDENGVVTGEAEGNARITLQVIIDGKPSLLAARCSVEIKSEFIVENRTLIAYKGKGGPVEIPDDEGILYIGAFAFAHFDLDNEKYVEKDEDGYYDLDEKKTALGNKTVTSVIIPEGVEAVNKYAFYNCEILESVTLPSTCKTIEANAFAGSPKLKNINLDNVRVISDYAFYKCTSLDDGGDLSKVYAIGSYAFQETKFESLKLLNLSLCGTGAFKGCTNLTEVELGKKTRIAKNMFERTSIEEIVIYSDIVQDDAFKNCTSLTSVKFMGDMTYLGKNAFKGCVKLENVDFEAVCEEIADYAFYGCVALKSFTLPNCEVVLDHYVFAYSGLETLKFEKDTVIKSSGVGNFSNISNLTVEVANEGNYKVVDGAVYTTDDKALIFFIRNDSVTEFVVPGEVEVVFDGAFSLNSTLETISFETDSVLKSIGYGAFYNCTGLKTVLLPYSPSTIGTVAFYNTTALETITIENAKSIGDYAFENSGIKNLHASMFNDVTIGVGAFTGTERLENASFGSNATIGANAFANSSIKNVEISGSKGATLGEGAFRNCVNLESFSFDKIDGVIPAYAFSGCVKIVAVEAPEVTEIGAYAFSENPNLSSFSAAKLTKVGDYAFSAYSTKINVLDQVKNQSSIKIGAPITVFDAPNLTYVGNYAFYCCTKLQEIDLSKVTYIGDAAFTACESLANATLSENLRTLNLFTFYACTSINDIDLSNIVEFEQYALYGVKLPKTLKLDKAEIIGNYAFAEPGSGGIVNVVAPSLKTIGDQAFYACVSLKDFYAPSLETIGMAAFAGAALEEFLVFNSLKSVDSQAFTGCEKLSAFVASSDEAQDGRVVFDNVMVEDGVLYTIVPNGYVLTSYPVAKADEEFTIADGTVRIEFCAFISNKNIETVIIPQTVKYIGNNAFYDCRNLKTVVFNSYYAPVLEGTMTGETISITPETLSKYPDFDNLYKYDFYFRKDRIIAYPYYYATFVDYIATTGAQGLNYIIPKSSKGYDSKIYTTYFENADSDDKYLSDAENALVKGPYALAFIEAVKKLPTVADRFDKALVDAAINAYNALEVKADELKLVDESYITRFNKARSEYNVSYAEYKINRLFDMYNDEYSFNALKEAREIYLSLSDEERALVSNAAVIDEKIAQLTAAMGVAPDFSLSFSEQNPEQPPVDDPVDSGSGKIVIIICASVLGAAVIAAVVFFILKKKGTKKDVASDDEAAAEDSYTVEETASETENAPVEECIEEAAETESTEETVENESDASSENE